MFVSLVGCLVEGKEMNVDEGGAVDLRVQKKRRHPEDVVFLRLFCSVF